MKTSNKLLLVFLAFLIFIMIFAALQLKAEYKKINLKDKFRDYERIAVSPVKFLIIQGSKVNSTDMASEFFVNCTQGNERVLLLPKDAFFKNHFKYQQSGDTLVINSTLPYPYGLTIFLSGVNLEKIEANSTKVLLEGFDIGQLQVNLERNAIVNISDTEIKDLSVNTTDKSRVQISKNSIITNLDLNLQKNSEVELGQVKIGKLSLQMSSSAKVTTTKENLLLLREAENAQ